MVGKKTAGRQQQKVRGTLVGAGGEDEGTLAAATQSITMNVTAHRAHRDNDRQPQAAK